MVRWLVGLVRRLVGWSVRRFVGSSVRRFVGSSVRRFVGSSVRWFVGSLVRWFVGSLVRWFVGSLVRFFQRFPRTSAAMRTNNGCAPTGILSTSTVLPLLHSMPCGVEKAQNDAATDHGHRITNAANTTTTTMDHPHLQGNLRDHRPICFSLAHLVDADSPPTTRTRNIVPHDFFFQPQKKYDRNANTTTKQQDTKPSHRNVRLARRDFLFCCTRSSNLLSHKPRIFFDKVDPPENQIGAYFLRVCAVSSSEKRWCWFYYSISLVRGNDQVLQRATSEVCTRLS